MYQGLTSDAVQYHIVQYLFRMILNIYECIFVRYPMCILSLCNRCITLFHFLEFEKLSWTISARTGAVSRVRTPIYIRFGTGASSCCIPPCETSGIPGFCLEEQTSSAIPVCGELISDTCRSYTTMWSGLWMTLLWQWRCPVLAAWCTPYKFTRLSAVQKQIYWLRSIDCKQVWTRIAKETEWSKGKYASISVWYIVANIDC